MFDVEAHARASFANTRSTIFAGESDIVRGIEQFRQLRAIEMRFDFGVRGEQVEECAAAGDHLTADVVD